MPKQKPKLLTILRWLGGKAPLAACIANIINAELNYLHWVEPFCGGASVTFALDPEGRSEVVNDLNDHITDLFRVLKDEVQAKKFIRIASVCPFSESLWLECAKRLQEGGSKDIIEKAFDFFVVNRQSHAGQMRGFSRVTKARTRRGMNNDVSAWMSAVDRLQEVSDRLRRIVILQQDAMKVIRDHDSKQTTMYIDAPYLKTTRSSPNAYGQYEIGDAYHHDLLDLVNQCDGKFAISGYPSPVYEKALTRRRGWKRVSFDVPKHIAQTKVKARAEEVLWYRPKK